MKHYDEVYIENLPENDIGECVWHYCSEKGCVEYIREKGLKDSETIGKAVEKFGLSEGYNVFVYYSCMRTVPLQDVLDGKCDLYYRSWEKK